MNVVFINLVQKNTKETPMLYKPVEIDRKNLTIIGVNFSSVNNFYVIVNALGTVIFEGFDLTPKSMEIIRDYLSDKITIDQLIEMTKEKVYV
jgi:hypothetical protein